MFYEAEPLYWKENITKVQSNLCTTTTPGTRNLWALLTGGCYSEVALCYKNRKWDPKMVVAVDNWSLFEGGR
jgi:hypothetical protein